MEYEIKTASLTPNTISIAPGTVGTVITTDLTTSTISASYAPVGTMNYSRCHYGGNVIEENYENCGYTALFFFVDDIKSIREVVTGKVVEVTFYDDKKISACLREPDVFSIKTALYYIIAKRNYKALKKECVESDLDAIVEYMRYSKKWSNRVEEGMKVWEEQERKERRRQKRIAQKERRAEREKAKKLAEREEAIKIQEEAFLRAFKQIKADQIAEEMKHGQI